MSENLADVDAMTAEALPADADAALAPVYDWLVTVVAFPFDATFGDRPPWLNLRRLAEAWQRHDPGEDAETWLFAITEETGWYEDGEQP